MKQQVGGMVEGVQNHVKSTNFGYRSELMTLGIKYFTPTPFSRTRTPWR